MYVIMYVIVAKGSMVPKAPPPDTVCEKDWGVEPGNKTSQRIEV